MVAVDVIVAIARQDDAAVERFPTVCVPRHRRIGDAKGRTKRVDAIDIVGRDGMEHHKIGRRAARKRAANEPGSTIAGCDAFEHGGVDCVCHGAERPVHKDTAASIVVRLDAIEHGRGRPSRFEKIPSLPLSATSEFDAVRADVAVVE